MFNLVSKSVLTRHAMAFAAVMCVGIGSMTGWSNVAHASSAPGYPAAQVNAGDFDQVYMGDVVARRPAACSSASCRMRLLFFPWLRLW